MENKIPRFRFDRFFYVTEIVCRYNNKNIEWNSISIYLIFSLAIFLLAGCNMNQSKQLYKNSISGISLEKPSNWEVTYSERDGLITLFAKRGFWDRKKSRIEIYGNACRSFTIPWLNSMDEIKSDVNRIRILYGLDAITYSQEPNEYIIDGFEVVMAAIDIPTVSMLNDPNRIQVDHKDQNTLQTIELYAISNNNNGIMGYIYKGNDEVLNKQAREIIESIQFLCADD